MLRTHRRPIADRPRAASTGTSGGQPQTQTGVTSMIRQTTALRSPAHGGGGTLHARGRMGAGARRDADRGDPRLRPLTIRAVLFDASGADREVDLVGDGRPKLGEKQLLWIDLDDRDPDGAPGRRRDDRPRDGRPRPSPPGGAHGTLSSASRSGRPDGRRGRSRRRGRPAARGRHRRRRQPCGHRPRRRPRALRRLPLRGRERARARPPRCRRPSPRVCSTPS